MFEYIQIYNNDIKDSAKETASKVAEVGEVTASYINWETVITAVLASSFPIIIAIIGAAIVWGRYKERIDNHEQRLDTSNGKIEKQGKKDFCLQQELEGIKQRCVERESLWRRNNNDHIELFSRINSLEKGLAAMPGQLKDMIDASFKEWQVVWRRDIKYTIYEIDREKAKANGINGKNNKSGE